MSRWPLYRSGLEGIAVVSALGIDIGTSLEEDLDDVEVASIRSGLEGIAVVSALGIDIGTSSRGGSGRCRGGLLYEAAWRALP